MRIVVTGATGNVGPSLLAALAGEPPVREIIGIARRAPEVAFPRHASCRRTSRVTCSIHASAVGA